MPEAPVQTAPPRVHPLAGLTCCQRLAHLTIKRMRWHLVGQANQHGGLDLPHRFGKAGAGGALLQRKGCGGGGGEGLLVLQTCLRPAPSLPWVALGPQHTAARALKVARCWPRPSTALLPPPKASRGTSDAPPTCV